jgi:hypothetical protein
MSKVLSGGLASQIGKKVDPHTRLLANATWDSNESMTKLYQKNNVQ